MKKNAGIIDRVLRILLGAGMITLAFYGPQTKWGFLGAVPIITGLLGFCPLYVLLGISSCESSKEASQEKV
jgi:hypothetical protein